MGDLRTTEDSLVGHDEFLSVFAEKHKALVLEKRANWTSDPESTDEILSDSKTIPDQESESNMDPDSADSMAPPQDTDPESTVDDTPESEPQSDILRDWESSPRGSKICKRCSSIIMVLEETEGQEDVTDISLLLQQYAGCEEIEDDTDGGPSMHPKVNKVILKCNCHATAWIKRHLRDDVLCPTLIMHYYINRSPTIRREETTSNTHAGIRKLFAGCIRGNTIAEDVTADQHRSTMELFITDPESEDPEEKQIPLGATVTTLEDEHGYLRHFVDTVQPNTPASTIELRSEDELLLLNDKPLVDKDAEQLQHILGGVYVDQPFTLITRRMIKPESRLFGLGQVQYEYWQISTTIVLEIDEGTIIPEAANVLRTSMKEGDIWVREPVDVQARYIKTGAGYLKFQDGQIDISRDLRDDDVGFKFYLITYDGMLRESGGLVQKRIRLLRHTSGSNDYFLYMSPKSESIILKIAPSAIGPVPSKDIINSANPNDTFEIKSALFLSDDRSGGEIFYLETATKLGFYLKAQSTHPFISIFRPSKPPLQYIDGVRFEMLPCLT